jgi:hypothetical protein
MPFLMTDMYLLMTLLITVNKNIDVILQDRLLSYPQTIHYHGKTWKGPKPSCLPQKIVTYGHKRY